MLHRKAVIRTMSFNKIYPNISTTVFWKQSSMFSWPFWAAVRGKCSLIRWNLTPGGGSVPPPHSGVAAQTYGSLSSCFRHIYLKKNCIKIVFILCLFHWNAGSKILVCYRSVQLLHTVPSQVVEHSHVGIGVVEVVGVGWVVLFCPIHWQRTVKIENVVLRFGFIIYAVEADHLFTHK